MIYEVEVKYGFEWKEGLEYLDYIEVQMLNGIEQYFIEVILENI